MWDFSWDLGSLDRSRALVRKERGDTETGLAPCVLWNGVLGNSVTSQEQTSPTLVPPRHSPCLSPETPVEQDGGRRLRAAWTPYFLLVGGWGHAR